MKFDHRNNNNNSLDSFTLPKLTQQNCQKEMHQQNTNTFEFHSKSEFLNANSNSFLLANGPLVNYNKDQNKTIIADVSCYLDILFIGVAIF